MIPAVLAALLTAVSFLTGGPIVRPTQPVQLGPARIMPLGDSLTEGFRSSDGTGYRGPLDKLLTRPHVWVGSLTDPRGLHHEGHGGWTLDQLAGQAQAWTAAAKPSIVLLQAGTNDVRAGDSSSTMLADLMRLVAAVRAAAPGATIYIARIPDLPQATAAQRAQLKAFNASIPNPDLPFRWVDMSVVLGAGDLVDGIHPGDAGYAKMARAWAGVIA